LRQDQKDSGGGKRNFHVMSFARWPFCP
jgi:hypothetical protein